MSTLPTFLVFDSKRVEIKKCLNPLCYIGLKHVCGRGDLNPHGSPRYPLNIVGLVSNRSEKCKNPYFIDVVRTYKFVSCRKKAYFFMPRVHSMSTFVLIGEYADSLDFGQLGMNRSSSSGTSLFPHGTAS